MCCCFLLQPPPPPGRAYLTFAGVVLDGQTTCREVQVARWGDVGEGHTFGEGVAGVERGHGVLKTGEQTLCMRFVGKREILGRLLVGGCTVIKE